MKQAKKEQPILKMKHRSVDSKSSQQSAEFRKIQQEHKKNEKLEHNKQMAEKLLNEEIDKRAINTSQSDLNNSNLQDSDVRSVQSTGSQRSWIKRTFSKLDKGSLRGSIFTLCSCAIGAGTLSLPYMFKQSGLIIGLFFLIHGCIFSTIGGKMLMKAAYRSGMSHYSKLAYHCGGKKLETVLQICIVCYLFGVITGVQIVVCSLTQFVLITLGITEAEDIMNIEFRLMFNAGLAILILFPLCMVKDLSGFRYVSIISLVSLFYLMIVLLMELQSYATEFYTGDNIVYAKWDLNIFLSFALTIYCFNCVPAILPVYSELQYPVERRMSKIINRANLSSGVFYLVISSAGYLSTFENTRTICIERDSLNGSPDFAALLAIFIIILMLITSVGPNYFPARNMLVYIIQKKDKFTDKENVIYSICFLGLSVICAITYPNISSVLSIVGGSCAITMCYTIPTICYIQTSEVKASCKNIFLGTYMGILTLMGYISVGLNVYLMTTGKTGF